jgi:hypothetical protein
LQHALRKLGFEYEERGSSLVVSAQGLEIASSVQSLVGTATITAKQTPGKLRLTDVVAQVADYLSTTELESDRTVFAYCSVVGIVLLVLGLALPG